MDWQVSDAQPGMTNRFSVKARAPPRSTDTITTSQSGLAVVVVCKTASRGPPDLKTEFSRDRWPNNYSVVPMTAERPHNGRK